MADDIITIRVSYEPEIYRDIEIGASASLSKLAEEIVKSFDFDFDHAFGFYSKLTGNFYKSPMKFELFADLGEAKDGALSVKKTKVIDAFAKDKTKFLFLFDYGDEWTFKTERLSAGAKVAKVKYPRVTNIVGDGPEQYPDMEE